MTRRGDTREAPISSHVRPLLGLARGTRGICRIDSRLRDDARGCNGSVRKELAAGIARAAIATPRAALDSLTARISVFLGLGWRAEIGNCGNFEVRPASADATNGFLVELSTGSGIVGII